MEQKSFYRVERTDLALLKESQSTDRGLLEILFRNNRYIYVEDDQHRLEGVISIGDFRGKYNYLNRSFLSIPEEEKMYDKALELYEKNELSKYPCCHPMEIYYTF